MPPDISTQPSAPQSTPDVQMTTPAPAPSKSQKNMPMKLLIAVLVVFLAMVLVYALSRPKTKTTTSTQNVTQLQKAVVTITSAGFSPETIKVKTGTQVKWTNNDSAPHQVAADPYPKDNSIPDFNSSVILQKGDSHAFTFSKAGTYTYHDERNPLKLTGTVIVE